jgi:hypothetical protein
MNADSSLDPRWESLQSLLSSAFKVQESGLDAQSLSVIAELQRLITTADPDADHAMQMIADRTRRIGNATGIGIALLKGDQLVYRAGSGSAAAHVGKHMLAVLSTPAHKVSGSEIMRVENAQTDSRIQAAICRELAALSLLMLPIYDNGAVVGVLEVLFDEPHTFVAREVRAYEMITGLIEEVVTRDLQTDERSFFTAPVVAVSIPVEHSSQPMRVPGSRLEPATVSRLGSILGPARMTAMAAIKRLKRLWKTVAVATTGTRSLPRPLFDTIRWNLAALLVVAGLIIANWIAHRPVSPVKNSMATGSIVAGQVSPIAAKQSPTNHASNWQMPAATKEGQGLLGSGFRRVWVNQNEIDYIAEDVTIRHFGRNVISRRLLGYEQVDIGDDVTVRYFESTAAGSTEPVTIDSPPHISQ